MPTIREMAEITVTKQTSAKLTDGFAAVAEVFAEFGRTLARVATAIVEAFGSLVSALQPKGPGRPVLPQMSYPGVDMQFRHRGR
jgi:hypothetical protein